MDGRQHVRAVRKRHEAPANLTDRQSPARQAAQRRRAKRDNNPRSDQSAFDVEPDVATVYLVGVRPLVQSPFSARFEFEMLHSIGDENFAPRDAGLVKRTRQNGAGGTHEWLALSVFLIARLLADQHDGSARRTFARHDLGAEFIERAARAFRLGGVQRL